MPYEVHEGDNTFTYDEDYGHSHVDTDDRKVGFEEVGDLFEEMMLVAPMLPDDLGHSRERTDD